MIGDWLLVGKAMPRGRRSMTFMKEFAKRLCAVRITSGYKTADEFAQALGIKGQTYRRYERHEAMPPHEALVEISRLTDVSIDWLLTGESKPNHPAIGRTAGADPVT